MDSLFTAKEDISLTSAAAEHYLARFRKVLAYMDEHLHDDLSVEQIGQTAGFSKYHFQRQFSELFGLSVYKYIQLQRLKRASYQLVFRQPRQIIDIALACGYENPESFTRAFKKNIGQAPFKFRKQPQWIPWHATYQPLNHLRITHMTSAYQVGQVRLIAFKPTRVAAIEHRGDPRLVGHSVRNFIEWRKQVGLSPKASATFNILYDDPAGTAPQDYRLDICATTNREIASNLFGVIEKTLPGGRCAVLRHQGSDNGLGQAIAYLYSQWLPHSGEALRDFPIYVQRVSFFPDVAEHQAVTDIFLPLDG